MKISQMTTDQGADVTLRIAEPVSKIMHDEQFLAVIEQIAKGSDNPVKFFADNIAQIANLALKSNRESVYEIVAALNGKTAQEIAEQRFVQTIKDIRESVDKDLIDFFGSSGA